MGINAGLAVRAVGALPWYLASLRTFRGMAARSAGEFPIGKLYPCLDDRVAFGSNGRGHYFHQDILVARRIFEAQPARHADVGSRIEGFVAHVAVFREIEVFDIRAIGAPIANVVFRQADLAGSLPEAFVEAYDSVSCLHTIEHVGLGRYGDALDYDGHAKALRFLTAMVKPGGMLYLSAPVGPQRIEFNAHRVFAVGYLLDLCRRDFDVVRVSCVDDNGDLTEEVALTPAAIGENFGCTFGLAILELRKR